MKRIGITIIIGLILCIHSLASGGVEEALLERYGPGQELGGSGYMWGVFQSNMYASRGAPLSYPHTNLIFEDFPVVNYPQHIRVIIGFKDGRVCGFGASTAFYGPEPPTMQEVKEIFEYWYGPADEAKWVWMPEPGEEDGQDHLLMHWWESDTYLMYPALDSKGYLYPELWFICNSGLPPWVGID